MSARSTRGKRNQKGMPNQKRAQSSQLQVSGCLCRFLDSSSKRMHLLLFPLFDSKRRRTFHVKSASRTKHKDAEAPDSKEQTPRVIFSQHQNTKTRKQTNKETESKKLQYQKSTDTVFKTSNQSQKKTKYGNENFFSHCSFFFMFHSFFFLSVFLFSLHNSHHLLPLGFGAGAFRRGGRSAPKSKSSAALSSSGCCCCCGCNAAAAAAAAPRARRAGLGGTCGKTRRLPPTMSSTSRHAAASRYFVV